MKLTIYFTILTIIFSDHLEAQTLSENRKYEISLDYAGNNKSNLLKVIEYYSIDPNDSLKLKATKYLIENMTGHYSFEDKNKINMDSLVEIVYNKESKEKSRIWGTEYQEITKQLWDSLFEVSNNVSLKDSYIYDNKCISAELLIENIEYSFKSWRLPWARHLNFEDFCEYILPYRFYNEPLEFWRSKYYNEFEWIIQKMEDLNSNDPMVACNLLDEYISEKFVIVNNLFGYSGTLSPKNLLLGKFGTCLEEAGIKIFALRALGIPVILNQVPRWANSNLGHSFLSVLNKNGEFVEMNGDKLGAEFRMKDKIVPKVYRTFYSIKDDKNLIDDVSTGILYPDFQRNQLDVTNMYAMTYDLEFEITNNNVQLHDDVFLCTYDGKSWTPFSTNVFKGGNVISFKDTGVGGLYLSAVYKDKLLPISDAIILWKDKSVSVMKPDTKNTEKIMFKAQYQLTKKLKEQIEVMKGGRIEASLNKDFSNIDTLYEINGKGMSLSSIKIENKNYRYIRYVFANGSYGNLAELEVYREFSDEKPIQGIPFASSKVSLSDLSLIFDGKLTNFVKTKNANDYDNEWVGIDLGEEISINKIVIMPPFDQQSIKGKDSELYYWDNEWIYLGNCLVNDRLDFEYLNVPKNSLLLIRSKEDNTQKKVFIYKGGEQLFF